MTNTSEIFPDKMEYGPVVVCSVFAGKNLHFLAPDIFLYIKVHKGTPDPKIRVPAFWRGHPTGHLKKLARRANFLKKTGLRCVLGARRAPRTHRWEKNIRFLGVYIGVLWGSHGRKMAIFGLFLAIF